MTTSAEHLVKDVVEATNSKDIDKAISLFSDDCIFEDVAPGIVCRGKEELRKFYKEVFSAFPDFNVELKSSFASGNQLCSEMILSGTHKGKMPDMPMEPTGKHWSVQSVRVDELREDKVYRTRVYFDMASLLQQIGVMPEPPK